MSVIEKKIKLKENERMMAVVRRYGPTFFWSWIFIIILFVLPFFFMFRLFQQGSWGQVIFVLLILVAFFLTLKMYYFWKKNIFVVTSHRLVDIESRGFFDQVISEVPYDQIEDVNGRIKGVWGTIFRFGTLVIQTGNGKVQIVVEKIKNPHYLQQEINELRERHLSRYAYDFSNSATEIITDKLYELEVEELLRIKKIIKKRIEKLSEKRQKN